MGVAAGLWVVGALAATDAGGDLGTVAAALAVVGGPWLLLASVRAVRNRWSRRGADVTPTAHLQDAMVLLEAAMQAARRWQDAEEGARPSAARELVSALAALQARLRPNRG